MKFFFLSLLLVSICFSTGFACGAPTAYQYHQSQQKSECEEACFKAHTEKDISGRSTCIRACTAKKDIEKNQY